MPKFDRDGGTRLTTGVGTVVIGLLDLDHALAPRRAHCGGRGPGYQRLPDALEDVDGALTAK